MAKKVKRKNNKEAPPTGLESNAASLGIAFRRRAQTKLAVAQHQKRLSREELRAQASGDFVDALMSGMSPESVRKQKLRLNNTVLRFAEEAGFGEDVLQKMDIKDDFDSAVELFDAIESRDPKRIKMKRKELLDKEHIRREGTKRGDDFPRPDSPESRLPVNPQESEASRDVLG